MLPVELDTAHSDLQTAVRREMKAGQPLARLVTALRDPSIATIRMPDGKYRLNSADSPVRHFHVTNNDDGPRPVAMHAEHLRDLTIDATGVRFSMSGYMNALSLVDCRNVTLRGLTIDWQEPLVAEARVVRASPGELRLTMPKDASFEVRGEDLWLAGDGWEKDVRHLLAVDPATRGPARGTGDNLGSPWGTPFKFAQDGAEVLLRGNFDVLPEVGQIVVLNPHHRPAVAIHVLGGENVTLEDVTIHASPGMAIVAEQVENLTMRRCRVLPADGRLVSANADATHCANCRGTVVLEDGHFEGQLDDPGNFHGMYVRLVQREGDDGFVLRRVHRQQQGAEFARPGDEVRWLEPATLRPIGRGIVAEVEEIDAERLRLRFKLAIGELPDDLAFENVTASPNVIVRGNRAGNNRARGFLVSTGGRNVVENNVIYSGGAGVQVHAGLGLWHESGAVRDLTIRNNTFRGCTEGGWSKAVIDINAQPENKLSNYPVHSGIRISDNTVEGTASPLVQAERSEPIEQDQGKD